MLCGEWIMEFKFFIQELPLSFSELSAVLSKTDAGGSDKKRVLS
jgi:hypothetical protein